MPIHADDRGWVLETNATGYALGLNPAGLLTHRYWGARLHAPDDYPAAPDPAAWASFNNPGHLTPEEYPGYGGASYIDPCLKVTFADGVRDLVLRFAAAEQHGGATPELHIHLRDAAYPLRITLHYRVHEQYDLIERRVTLTNEGDAPITIERALSAQWHLPHGGRYVLTYLTGRWLDEMHIRLARPDVQHYLIDQLDRLLAQNNIAFIKWDMNRNVSEPGWPDAPGDQRELWVRYVQGLYQVWGALRDRHPRVVWQSCSGGGGRADLAILRLADQIWVSDNTEPTARLAIQQGFSQIFPARTMEAWVTDVGAEYLPLAFRFHVSMCGALGVGGHLLRWTPEQRAEAAHWIARYKELRQIILYGDLYRLRAPQTHPFSALQYVDRDRSAGVLFAFRTHLPPPAQLPPIYLRGLDPEARYEVEGIPGARSGKAWMNAGLYVELADLQSTVRHIRRV